MDIGLLEAVLQAQRDRGEPCTEEMVHGLLDRLPPPVDFIGPDLAVRWRIGDQLLVLHALASVRGGVLLWNTMHAETVADDEADQFEWGEWPDDPWHWSHEVAPPEGWFTPGGRYLFSWQEFCDLWTEILVDLPDSLRCVRPGDLPPRIGFELHHNGQLVSAVVADRDGLTVTCAGTVHVPRHRVRDLTESAVLVAVGPLLGERIDSVELVLSFPEQGRWPALPDEDVAEYVTDAVPPECPSLADLRSWVDDGTSPGAVSVPTVDPDAVEDPAIRATLDCLATTRPTEVSQTLLFVSTYLGGPPADIAGPDVTFRWESGEYVLILQPLPALAGNTPTATVIDRRDLARYPVTWSLDIAPPPGWDPAAPPQLDTWDAFVEAWADVMRGLTLAFEYPTLGWLSEPVSCALGEGALDTMVMASPEGLQVWRGDEAVTVSLFRARDAVLAMLAPWQGIELADAPFYPPAAAGRWPLPSATPQPGPAPSGPTLLDLE